MWVIFCLCSILKSLLIFWVWIVWFVFIVIDWCWILGSRLSDLGNELRVMDLLFNEILRLLFIFIRICGLISGFLFLDLGGIICWFWFWCICLAIIKNINNKKMILINGISCLFMEWVLCWRFLSMFMLSFFVYCWDELGSVIILFKVIELIFNCLSVFRVFIMFCIVVFGLDRIISDCFVEKLVMCLGFKLR